MKTLIVCYQCILNLGLYLEYGNSGLFIDYLARSLNNIKCFYLIFSTIYWEDTLFKGK